MIVLVIVLFLIYILIVYRQSRSKWAALDKIPGPKGLPILGNVFDIGTTPKEMLEGICTLSQQYGGMFKMNFGPLGWSVVISDPKYMEQILLSSIHTHKGSWNDLAHDWLGNGMATSNGPTWRDARKLIQPIFNTKALEVFCKKFDARNKEFVEELKQQHVGQSINIAENLTRNSFLNAFKTLIGEIIDEGDVERYIHSAQKAAQIIMTRMFSIKIFDFIFRLSNDWTVLQKVVGNNHEILGNAMKKRRTEKAIHNDKKSFMDLLLDIQKENPQLLDEDLICQLDTFMFAGHDTVASASSFGVYELSCNREMQDKIFKESIDVFGEDLSAELTLKQLDSAVYLDLFCKEVLRKYPGGPMITRTTKDPLNLGGVDIPIGTVLIMLIYSMQRTPKYFPDPSKFDPDRFLPENKSMRPEYAYAAFSHGPRNCIGQRFASLEFKSTLMHLVRNFTISKGDPNFEVEVGSAATIIPVNGVLVRLDLRC